MPQMTLIDYLGLIGGTLTLFAFWRISIGAWKTKSLWYELDNFVGGFLLVLYTWEKHAYVNIVLNIIWAIVAFRGISSYAERKILSNKNFRRGYRKGRIAASGHRGRRTT